MPCAVRETFEESGVWPFSGHIKIFNYGNNNFKSFINSNNISLSTITASKIYPWINWRTPDCKKIYPRQWNMLVSILDENSVNQNHVSDETVEMTWIGIKDALNCAECDKLR